MPDTTDRAAPEDVPANPAFDEPPPHPARGFRSNLVKVPTAHLGSAAFNDEPTALHIAGTRSTHAELFGALELAVSADEAATVFQNYMAHRFELSPDFSGRDGPDGRRRFRASYLRLLKGWMFDANSTEGAVLKGWVESRFGLMPTYHKGPLRRLSDERTMAYVEEKLSSRFSNNMIALQLDLLYEFCQWSLHSAWRIVASGAHRTLYRGVNDFDEHPILARPDRRTAVLRLNNLVSFTEDRDIAGQFGDHILEARVPLVKLLFFRELLPRYPFAGEGEFLVIGGDYRVTVSVL
ncbi:MAG: NAD(+)--dinitrogen-reductase ADP-D-ribosyltransferase [Azospirillaceae bacterium]|nr:NAD(+)--dinitrogen-reductase ADP-D-ribosyltransferase [Azospirillaceae bacterium]